MEKYTNECLRGAIAQMCHSVGYQASNNSCLEVMQDLTGRFMRDLGLQIHGCMEHCGRNKPILDDVEFGFGQLQVNSRELVEYMKQMEPPEGGTRPVPSVPIRQQLKLNIPSSGVEELQMRPKHIPRHLPLRHAVGEIDHKHPSSSDAPGSTTPHSARTPHGKRSRFNFTDTPTGSMVPDFLDAFELGLMERVRTPTPPPSPVPSPVPEPEPEPEIEIVSEHPDISMAMDISYISDSAASAAPVEPTQSIHQEIMMETSYEDVIKAETDTDYLHDTGEDHLMNDELPLADTSAFDFDFDIRIDECIETVINNSGTESDSCFNPALIESSGSPTMQIPIPNMDVVENIPEVVVEEIVESSIAEPEPEPELVEPPREEVKTPVKLKQTTKLSSIEQIAQCLKMNKTKMTAAQESSKVKKAPKIKHKHHHHKSKHLQSATSKPLKPKKMLLSDFALPPKKKHLTLKFKGLTPPSTSTSLESSSQQPPPKINVEPPPAPQSPVPDSRVKLEGRKTPIVSIKPLVIPAPNVKAEIEPSSIILPPAVQSQPTIKPLKLKVSQSDAASPGVVSVKQESEADLGRGSDGHKKSVKKKKKEKKDRDRSSSKQLISGSLSTSEKHKHKKTVKHPVDQPIEVIVDVPEPVVVPEVSNVVPPLKVPKLKLILGSAGSSTGHSPRVKSPSPPPPSAPAETFDAVNVEIIHTTYDYDPTDMSSSPPPKSPSFYSKSPSDHSISINIASSPIPKTPSDHSLSPSSFHLSVGGLDTVGSMEPTPYLSPGIIASPRGFDDDVIDYDIQIGSEETASSANEHIYSEASQEEEEEEEDKMEQAKVDSVEKLLPLKTNRFLTVKWVCPVCGVKYADGGDDMIGCDSCEFWYHIRCLGILAIPEGDWYCPNCIHKKQTKKKGTKPKRAGGPGKRKLGQPPSSIKKKKGKK